MKHNVACGVANIPDRKPLEQFTAPSFGLLTVLKSLPENLQLDDTQCSLDAQDQLIIEIIQVINLLLVSDEGAKNLANLQKPAPVLVRAG
jgi:hypothetical protein